MVVGGFRWSKVVSKCSGSTAFGGKQLTLVKESRNSPKFKSLLLRQNKNPGIRFEYRDFSAYFVISRH